MPIQCPPIGSTLCERWVNLARQSRDQQQKDLFAAVFAFLREHPALLGSLVYVQITSIGIIYSWALYRSFDINIFDFAQANDFLLAGLEEPFAFVMSVITVILFGVEAWYFLSYRPRRESRPPSALLKALFPWMFVLVAVVYTIVPAYLYAKWDASSIQQGKAVHVTVRYKIEGQSREKTSQKAEFSLIGTSEKFAFLYDETTRRTLAVSLSDVQLISFPSK